MSRLESFIRRLQAQKACLEVAFERIAALPGPVLELGLGNGRTYDHLRERLPGREIYVFDRQIAAHPECIPDAAHMILGEVLETFPRALDRTGGRAALIHVDLGTADRQCRAHAGAGARHRPADRAGRRGRQRPSDPCAGAGGAAASGNCRRGPLPPLRAAAGLIAGPLVSRYR